MLLSQHFFWINVPYFCTAHEYKWNHWVPRFTSGSTTITSICLKRKKEKKTTLLWEFSTELDDSFRLHPCPPLLIWSLFYKFGRLCYPSHYSLPVPSSTIILGDININLVTHSKVQSCIAWWLQFQQLGQLKINYLNKDFSKSKKVCYS